MCVKILFSYITHHWNYGILATLARTIFKTRLNILIFKAFLILKKDLRFLRWIQFDLRIASATRSNAIKIVEIPYISIKPEPCFNR